MNNEQTHRPDRYEVLPGVQAWDILTPIVNRFPGIKAAYVYSIGKYFFRLGMKDDVVQELKKIIEYANKLIEEYAESND